MHPNVTSGSANYHETQTTVVVEFVSGALSDELREDGWKCFLLLFQTGTLLQSSVFTPQMWGREERARGLPTRWLLHRLLRRLVMRVRSRARPNSATFTSQGNLLTMMFLRAKSQCTICRDKARASASQSWLNAWNPSLPSPFWIWGAASPERCGRRRWSGGSAARGQCSGGTCGSAGRSSECRSSRTPWSGCTVLHTRTVASSQGDNEVFEKTDEFLSPSLVFQSSNCRMFLWCTSFLMMETSISTCFWRTPQGKKQTSNQFRPVLLSSITSSSVISHLLCWACRWTCRDLCTSLWSSWPGKRRPPSRLWSAASGSGRTW